MFCSNWYFGIDARLLTWLFKVSDVISCSRTSLAQLVFYSNFHMWLLSRFEETFLNSGVLIYLCLNFRIWLFSRPISLGPYFTNILNSHILHLLPSFKPSSSASWTVLPKKLFWFLSLTLFLHTSFLHSWCFLPCDSYTVLALFLYTFVFW